VLSRAALIPTASITATIGLASPTYSSPGVGGFVARLFLAWLSIVAAIALPLFALTGRADADGGHLTPAEAQYLEQLSTNGVPYQDAGSMLMIGYHICDDLLTGGQSLNSEVGREYATLKSSGMPWTRDQVEFIVAVASAKFCPSTVPFP
jgi:hypothetical protein